MKNRKTNWKPRILMAGISIFLGLLIIEAAIRIHPPYDLSRLLHHHLISKSDDLLGWSLLPNTTQNLSSEDGGIYLVKTNAQGVRDNPFTHTPEKKVILGLGDSFMFGAGIKQDKTLMAMLQKSLNKNYPGKIRTINAGVPGYGTHQQLVYYLERGKKDFKPDILIIGFYINDIADMAGLNDEYNFYHKSYPVVFARDNTNIDLNIRLPLPIELVKTDYPGVTNSHLISYIKKRLNRDSKEKMKADDEKIPLAAESLLFRKDHYANRNFIPYYYVDMMCQIFKKVEEEDNLKVLFVYLPSAREVETGAQEYAQENTHGDPNLWDWKFPSSIIEEFVKKNDIEFISLIPAFTKHWEDTKRSLYFNGRGHFTAEGHAVAAEATLPYIKKLLEEK